MEIKFIFILLKKKIISKCSIFKDSILYYPILFSIIVFVGFLITSRIDQSFGREFSINVHYFNSLFFAGSADAARSILSTIATGWATILSVAFSVTLITLQLSTTRYTSHLINKFEEDRINKLTLGWFIAVVLYSLLVLKTVRTDENTGDIFTPIIGVNVAIIIASIGLFIFILFINNVISYLKPKILVQRLVDQIICSIKPFEKRDIDERYLLHIKDEDNIAKEIMSKQKDIEKIMEIKSKEEGVLRNIEWNKFNSSLKNLNKNIEQSHILIEFHKFVGEVVNKGNIIVSIYSDKNNIIIKDNDKIWRRNSRIEERGKVETKREESYNQEGKRNIKNNNKINNKNSDYKDKTENETFEELEQKVISSININKDRDISKDPFFGIELLRSLAIKSASNNDTDVTNSCISGLFRILIYNLNNQDKFGIPFTIKVKDTIKHNKKEEKDKHINNYDGDKHNNKSNDDNYTKITFTIKPKEKPLTDTILSELSIINNNAVKLENIPVMKHLVLEYISTGKTLLENDKKDKFYKVTDWYSQKLTSSLESFPKEFQNEVFLNPLLEFQEYLSQNYDFATTSFSIYMKNIIKS
jgi:uncharacterized membrane protein